MRAFGESGAERTCTNVKARPHDRGPGHGRSGPVAHQGRDAYHEMMEMILGFWVSQTIRTIADWSLADHLAAGALTAGEIAGREGAAVETTVALLRAGVGLGLMTVSDDGRFHATERLATLRTGAPGSLRPIALSFIDPEFWRHSLRRRA